MFYIGWYIRDAQRHPQVPRLTESQVEAMDLVETIANDPAFHMEMNFRPGDVQLLNNAKILHAREAYEDADDPREQRHLLRLWLTAHTSRVSKASWGQEFPRAVEIPAWAHTAATTSAMIGSAHESPSAAFASRPMSTAIDKYAHRTF